MSQDSRSRTARFFAAWTPLLPYVAPIVVLILLFRSFSEELQLLDQGGPTNIFVWLGALGLLAGCLLAFCTTQPAQPGRWHGATGSTGLVAMPQYVLAGIALLLSLGAAWLVHTNGSPTVSTVAWILGLALILDCCCSSRLVEATRRQTDSLQRRATAVRMARTGSTRRDYHGCRLADSSA